MLIKFNKALKKVTFSNEIRELASNSFWSLIGAVFSKALLFFTWAWVARTLGQSLNGEVGIVRSTINLFIVFIGAGFSISANTFIPRFLDSDRRRVGNIIGVLLLVSLALALVLTTVLYVISPWLAKEVLNTPGIEKSLKIGSFFLLLSSMNSVVTGCLQGLNRFKSVAVVNLVNGISVFIFISILTNDSFVEGVFYGLTLGTLITLIISTIFFLMALPINRVNLSFKVRREFHLLMKFVIPAVLTGVMVVPFKWSIDAIMANTEDGINEIGLFTALILFQTFLTMFTNVLNAPMILLMSKKTNGQLVDRLNIILPWLIGVVASVPIFFFPKEIGILLGEQYTSAPEFISTLYLIVVSTVIILYKQGIARLMVVNDLMWFSLFSNMLWGFTLIISFLLFSTKSAYTMALSYVIAYVVNLLVILPFYIYRKIVPFNLLFNKWSICIWIVFIGVVLFILNFNLGVGLRVLFSIFLLSLFTLFFFNYLNFKQNENQQ